VNFIDFAMSFRNAVGGENHEQLVVVGLNFLPNNTKNDQII
jgi:hypothetical protein